MRGSRVPWHAYAVSSAQQRGAVWLTATLGFSALVAVELGALGVYVLAEQQTIGVAAAQMQADYAAQAGLAVAAALVSNGQSPDGVSGSCGKARYTVSAKRAGAGWLVVAEGRAEGPACYSAQQRIEATVSGSGSVKRLGYVRPLGPTSAGRT